MSKDREELSGVLAKDRIREVFLEMLQEKPFHKISVTEICKKAEINRSTYYKHYLDVYDLMEKTEDHLVAALMSWIDNLEVVGMEAALVALLCNMKENIQKYSALFGKNGAPGLLGRLSASIFPMFSERMVFPEHNVPGFNIKQICYSYISAGCTGILTYWMEFDFEQSPEDIARIILKMVDVTLQGMEQ